MAEKRVATSSFNTQKVARLTRLASVQIENKHDHQINIKFSQMLENALKRFNQTQNQNSCRWELEKLEEKRKLHGLKAKLRWRDQQRKHTALLKLCVPTNYDNIKASKAYDPQQFILQLQSVNFKITSQHLRSFQGFLDTQVRNHLKLFTTKNNAEEEWLYQVFVTTSEKLMGQNKSEFVDKREILAEEPVLKPYINENYMLCPSPISIAWSPQGMLALSSHRSVPRAKGAYIGTRKFLNFFFESSKTASPLVSRQDNQIFQEVTQHRQDQPTQIYDWAINQNLDFIDTTSNSKSIQPATPQISAFNDEHKRKHIDYKSKLIENRKNESMLLVDLSKLNGELARLYRQNFTAQQGEQHQHTHHDKVRLYKVEGQDKQLQNDLMFLLYRAADSKERSALQPFVKNQLFGYQKFFLDTPDILQYRIVCHLIDQKIKTTPKNYPLYLKAMMVENVMVSQGLGQYLTSFEKRLDGGKGMVPMMGLGSYMHFEYEKAEKIMFQITKKVVRQSKGEQALTKKYQLKRMVQLTKFIPNFIIENAQSVDKSIIQIQFYRRVIPILELRNRNSIFLEYRRIMRIILANDQIRNFIKLLNEMVDLTNSKDIESKIFLQQIIDTYNRRQQQYKIQKSFIRRLFRIECTKCQYHYDTYELFLNQEMRCEICNPIIR